MLPTDQDQLIIDNFAVARDVARRLFPYDDEYQGVAAEVLCKAARQWVADDELPERYGAFRRYLRIVLPGALIDFHRRWRKDAPRIGRRSWRFLSVDAPDRTGSTEATDSAALLDGVAVRERDLDEVVAETVDNEAVIAQIKPVTLARARRRADGYSLAEIATESGVSSPAVCHSFVTEARRLAGAADRDVIRGTRDHCRKRAKARRTA